MRMVDAWRRGLLAALAGISLALFTLPGHGAAVLLDPNEQRVALWQGLQTVADPQSIFTPQQVSAEVAAGRAGQLAHANATYGKWLPHPYWAQFELHNPGPESQRWLITYEQPTQDGIALWRRAGPGGDPEWAELQQPEDQTAYAIGSGHLYPVWLKFKGGKGVATFFGIMLAVAWPVGVLAALTWIAVAVVLRISSLSALVAAALAPLYALATDQSQAVIALAAFTAALIYMRHIPNIQRLLKGQEPRIGGDKKAKA